MVLTLSTGRGGLETDHVDCQRDGGSHDVSAIAAGEAVFGIGCELQHGPAPFGSAERGVQVKLGEFVGNHQEEAIDAVISGLGRLDRVPASVGSDAFDRGDLAVSDGGDVTRGGRTRGGPFQLLIADIRP